VVSYISTSLQNTTFVFSPRSGIDPYDHWSISESLPDERTSAVPVPSSYFVLFLAVKGLAFLWFRFVDRAGIRVVDDSGDAVVKEMFVDVLRGFFLFAAWAAIDDFLLREEDPIKSRIKIRVDLSHLKGVLAVDLELHLTNSRKDMAAIIAHHILHRRQQPLPVIIVVILELSDLLVSFLPRNSRHYRIELLELSLRVVVQSTESFFVFLVKLFLAEDQLIVGLVEGEGAVVILDVFILAVVVLQVGVVVGRRGSFGMLVECRKVDEKEGES
jgi:hypothetical protein